MANTKDDVKKIMHGGGFIVDQQHAEDVFIPEDFTEDQIMIQRVCRDFVREAGTDVHELDKQVALMEKAGELGLLGAHMPEEYGGMALDTNTNTLIGEELGHGGGSFDTTFAAHIGIGMLPILYFGTEAQRKQYLPGLCSGELKAAYCLTEPGSGSACCRAWRTRPPNRCRPSPSDPPGSGPPRRSPGRGSPGARCSGAPS
jgi:hypothetical protein